TLGAIRRSLRVLIMHYPVYRTYTWVCGHSPQDRQLFDRALEGARGELGQNDWPVLDQLGRWLGGDPLHASPPGSKRRFQRRLLARFHQLTAPAAAKAVEDTAFYRSAVLFSRNDVGSDPGRFSASPEWFHAECIDQAEHFPLGLLTTASHDHKRGEDARARPAPEPADELMLLPTLVAHWPLGLDPDDQQGCGALAERAGQWQQKALREAKRRSSWTAPDATYEQACESYLQRLLTAREGIE